MNIAVVDNGSSSIEPLLRLCHPHQTTVVAARHLKLGSLPPDTVIVLSGGHVRPVVGNDDFYAPELELIADTHYPIIGICLGFELIAYAAGAELLQLPVKEDRVVEVFASPEAKSWFGGYFLPVAEGHRWVIRDAPGGYIELASSTDGVEAIASLSKRIVGFQFHPELDDRGGAGSRVFKAALARIAPTA